MHYDDWEREVAFAEFLQQEEQERLRQRHNFNQLAARQFGRLIQAFLLPRHTNGGNNVDNA